MDRQSLFKLGTPLGENTSESDEFCFPRISFEDFDEQTLLGIGITCVCAVLDIVCCLFHESLQACFDGCPVWTYVVFVFDVSKPIIVDVKVSRTLG